MSKGKEYFDALLIESLEKIVEKERNANTKKVRSKVSGNSPKSPGPIRLSNYMKEVTLQKKEDGRTSLLNHGTPGNEGIASSETGEGPNSYSQKLSQLKDFVKSHIDTEENYNTFETIVKSLEELHKDRKPEAEIQRKSSAMENMEQNFEYFPKEQEQHRKMTFDLVSPSRIKKLTSNKLPMPSTTIRSMKGIPSEDKKYFQGGYS